jgi:hypothetical protein
MEFRIQAFEFLWRNRLLPPQPLSRTEDYDDYATLLPVPALVRTNADTYKTDYKDISDEAYWEEVFDPLAYEDEDEVYDMLLLE